jgi:CRP-like cAMP-binding protein
MTGPLTHLDWIGLMQAHPELVALPTRLRRQAINVVAAEGEPVFRLGSQPRNMLWVLDGEVRLVRRSRSGTEIVLQRAYSGFVAEASLESSRYHCDAVAATDSRLLGFPIQSFREAVRRDEKFRMFWMRRLAREVRLLRAQCERLNLRSATDRIEHYIEVEGDSGRIELRRTKKAWAAELGLSHEALYRTLATLQHTGRITAVEKKGTLMLTLNTVAAPK